jgi:hypothetical protein
MDLNSLYRLWRVTATTIYSHLYGGKGTRKGRAGWGVMWQRAKYWQRIVRIDTDDPVKQSYE